MASDKKIILITGGMFSNLSTSAPQIQATLRRLLLTM